MIEKEGEKKREESGKERDRHRETERDRVRRGGRETETETYRERDVDCLMPMSSEPLNSVIHKYINISIIIYTYDDWSRSKSCNPFEMIINFMHERCSTTCRHQ